MTEKEVAVLGQLTPQDYLQFMQGVWAQVTVLAPDELMAREAFSKFSKVLNDLEALVVVELEHEGKCTSETFRKLEVLRQKMNEAYSVLENEVGEYNWSKIQVKHECTI